MRAFRLVAGLAAVAALTLAPSAWADNSDSDEGYGYIFKDDPLDGAGYDPNGDMLRVRPPPGRTMLIRPRTQFVVEMLKSVEHI